MAVMSWKTTNTIAGIILLVGLVAIVGRLAIWEILNDDSTIVEQFHSDDYDFSDARKRCRDAIRKFNPNAKFNYTIDRRYRNAIISRLDWETENASHQSYCKVINRQVVEVTIDRVGMGLK
jgi:hypothetical protein